MIECQTLIYNCWESPDLRSSGFVAQYKFPSLKVTATGLCSVTVAHTWHNVTFTASDDL